MIAPAARRRATTGASTVGRVWANGFAPPVVGIPATSTMSFTPTGTPCSGPRDRPVRASARRSRAVTRAPSWSTSAQARTAPASPRMRASHAAVSATEHTGPERPASPGAPRPSATRAADGIEDLRDDLEASERGHEIGAGVTLAHGQDELLRHLDAGAKRMVSGLAQTAADRLGDRDARDLVVEELGVARAMERKDADQHWNR